MTTKVTKRKDSRGRVLRPGEYELRKKKSNGTAVSYYSFQYQDATGKRSSVSAPDLATLRAKEEELQRDFFDGIKSGREKKKTVGEMIDIYLATKINLAATTLANYQYVADHFIKESRIGSMLITDVNKSDIQKFYGGLLETGTKANTLENLQTILHPTFQRAIDDGYIRINPTQGVIAELKKSKHWQKPKKHALTEEEQVDFISFVRDHPIYDHWRPVFTVLLGTGLRIGEAIGLTWDDVDLAGGVIRVGHNLVYRMIDGECGYIMNTPKTDAGRREIYANDQVADALRELRRENFKNGFGAPVEIGGTGYNLVFRNRFGGPLAPPSVNRAIGRIVRDYNAAEAAAAEKEKRPAALLPQFSVHQIRHTFASRLCENCTDIKAIQDVMGHSSIETTLGVYAESNKQTRRQAMATLRAIKIS